MRLSVVVPVFNQDNDVVSFVDKLSAKLKEHTDDFNIIISTAEDFAFVERLHSDLQDKADIMALKTTDDYQQIVMAGVDKADGDATIIITPDYDVNLIDNMIKDWLDGKKVVCFRRKHSKLGRLITKLRLKIYNLFLFLFGDIFSIGILKDAQLLDKEVVDKMKNEQDMAHRFRTMYAPLDYNTAVHEIDHPIEKFETKGVPQFDFWLGCVGAILTLFAFVTCIILAIGLSAPIWVWTMFIVFGLLFEFLFMALVVNATARVKIGILHNMDTDGKIYNLAQEYHKNVASANWSNASLSSLSAKNTSTKKTKSTKNTKTKSTKTTAKVDVAEDANDTTATTAKAKKTAKSSSKNTEKGIKNAENDSINVKNSNKNAKNSKKTAKISNKEAEIDSETHKKSTRAKTTKAKAVDLTNSEIINENVADLTNSEIANENSVDLNNSANEVIAPATSVDLNATDEAKATKTSASKTKKDATKDTTKKGATKSKTKGANESKTNEAKTKATTKGEKATSPTKATSKKTSAKTTATKTTTKKTSAVE